MEALLSVVGYPESGDPLIGLGAVISGTGTYISLKRRISAKKQKQKIDQLRGFSSR